MLLTSTIIQRTIYIWKVEDVYFLFDYLEELEAVSVALLSAGAWLVLSKAAL